MNGIPITTETLVVRVVTLEREMKEVREELQDHGSRLEKTERGHDVVEAELTGIRSLCAEIKADVKDLKERPVKRYDTIANAIVQWLILAVLGAVVVFK